MQTYPLTESEPKIVNSGLHLNGFTSVNIFERKTGHSLVYHTIVFQKQSVWVTEMFFYFYINKCFPKWAIPPPGGMLERSGVGWGVVFSVAIPALLGEADGRLL